MIPCGDICQLFRFWRCFACIKPGGLFALILHDADGDHDEGDIGINESGEDDICHGKLPLMIDLVKDLLCMPQNRQFSLCEQSSERRFGAQLIFGDGFIVR